METPTVINLYAVTDADGQGYFQVFAEPFGDGACNSTYHYHYPKSPGPDPKCAVVKIWVKVGDAVTIFNPGVGRTNRTVKIETLSNCERTFVTAMEFDPKTIISFSASK